MARNYYDQPFFHQELHQPLSTPQFDHHSYSNMPYRPLPTLSSTLAPDTQLAENVERAFGYRQQPGNPFDDDHSETSTLAAPDEQRRELSMMNPDSNNDYMGRNSPFSLDSPQGDMSFIDWFPRGEATLTYLKDSGEVQSISNLNPSYFEERCPLLAQAFEPSRSGPQLHLESLNPATAMPFVRYLYTGTYAAPGCEGEMYEDVPTSVLLHCQLFRLGHIYECVELKQQAYVNITRQCEFGCSSPEKPIDLCEAIQYVYKHLREHANIIETLVCYCVTCFLKHRLADDFEFRTMAYDLRPFHQDLAKECMKRDFEDETASAIIQMPFRPYAPETYASREDITASRAARGRDVVYHFHGNDEFGTSPKKRKRPEMVATGPGLSGITLALRQKQEEVLMETGDLSVFEDPQIGSSKRRTSTPIKQEAESAGFDSVSIKQEETSASSDSEFEVVAGPEDANSENESDGDTPVMVERTASDGIPSRRQSVANSVTFVEAERQEHADSGSEPDWTLV